MLRCKNAFVRFDIVKCDAEHFTKSNLTNIFLRTFSKGKCSTRQMLQMYLVLCKNTFLRTFSLGKCSASHFAKQNVIFVRLCFLLFCIFVKKNTKNTTIFLTFCKAKCKKSKIKKLHFGFKKM